MPPFYYPATLKWRGTGNMVSRWSFVRPSVFFFPDDNFSKWQWIFTKLGVCIDIVEILFGIAIEITWVNSNGFSPNLMCALMLWRSGFGLLIHRFRQFLTVICPRHAHIFVSRQELSKYQWIFTELGTCFDIGEMSHENGRVLWFHVGFPLVHPSVCRTSVRIFFPYYNLSK